ncbi:MAG: efflux RND transporter periplasmic adaptor subunit [Phycisphaerales bacterium]|nr:efflux RND transporter periplasmic adaptor subunit [Phycisphaerales bacterium]
MFRSMIVPLLAVAGFAFAVQTVMSQSQEKPRPKPIAEPARSPYADSVAGSGIIEASTRNIAVGTNIAGIVSEVFVEPGAKVKAGDALMRIDDRTLRSELATRKAALEIARSQAQIAQAQVDRLKQQPRKEDVPPAKARVDVAKAQLEDAKEVLALMDAVTDKRAIVKEDLTRRQNAVLTANARLEEAQASFEQLLAGAWSQDIAVAEAQLAQARAGVTQAEANVAATQTELDRLVVRSPINGEVLQVNTRVGEYAQAGALSTPLMLVGNTDVLHVRIDVDENDAWRVRSGAKARVSLRGNPQIATDNTSFVRIEPFVIPKRSLTGDSTERVDTRVLQVVYSFPKSALNAYVGQQVDVRIDATGVSATTGTGASSGSNGTSGPNEREGGVKKSEAGEKIVSTPVG